MPSLRYLSHFMNWKPMMSTPGPLTGLRVLEFGYFVSRHSRRGLPAYHGADVIDIEPRCGDPIC